MASTTKATVHLGLQSRDDENQADNVREVPAILAHLSPDELKALEKRLVRKVDIRLLPTMTLIYVSN